MKSQTDSISVTVERTDTISRLLERVKEEVSGLVADESQHREDILIKTQNETQVLRDAYNAVKNKVNELEAELEKFKGPTQFVLCLVDGDGVIFSPDLLTQGKDGGFRAGQMLSESVRQHFLDEFNIDGMHFWVHIFYNKKGLMDAIVRAGYSSARDGFEEFTMGFNDAGLRFIMVDVGYGKEKADKKITAMLEDYVRLPQVCKILFGGCHDGGYVPILRSQMTAGFGDKLVLLRGYKVSPPEIDQLGLPSIRIPNLFIEEKLIDGRPRPVSGDLAYSTVVRTETMPRISTRTLRPDVAGNVYSNANDPSIGHRASASIHVDPNTDTNDLNPRPCIPFYLLGGCKNEKDCKYGHHYILQTEHYDMLRTYAKSSPCTANKSEACPHGDKCIYGHVCPNGPTCGFKAEGRCWFTGKGMHNVSTS